MLNQFPKLKPYKEEYIEVGDLHELHVNQAGNPNGIPVIVVHGGPGAGCPDSYRQFFNPKDYRIILVDQRGAGKSRPNACLKYNTTQDLVLDIEKVRVHLGLSGDKKPLLFGGSWGSTLSLAYAEQYPQNVAGLILRGIWLVPHDKCSAYLSEDSNAAISNPAEWLRFKTKLFDNPYRQYSSNEIITALYEKCADDDPEIWWPAAAALSRWETVNSTKKAKLEEELAWAKSDDGLRMGRIEAHYKYNLCFLAKDQIVNNAHKLMNIPSIDIVQGKNDKVCPPEQAQSLIDALKGHKNLRVHWTEAGHSAMEPENLDRLIYSAQKFARDHKVKKVKNFTKSRRAATEELLLTEAMTVLNNLAWSRSTKSLRSYDASEPVVSAKNKPKRKKI